MKVSVDQIVALVQLLWDVALTCWQAAQPELYLLSAEETDSSFGSQSFTTDTSSSSPEQQVCFHPPKTCGVPTGTKEPVKFPHIPQCSQQPPPPSRLEEEGEDEEDDQSCSSSEGENEALCSIRREEGKCHNPRILQLISLKKGRIKHETVDPSLSNPTSHNLQNISWL